MLTDKSVAIDPRYEAVDPTLAADQWDDSEPSNVEELERQLALQSSKELDKIAIRYSRLHTLSRVCALLVPVALSFGILQLSWRHVYWRNSNDKPRSISENLAVLQIAAKVHEILIVLSLSDIVLHYLRQQLSSSHGIPFGLFTSAYQVALGSQPLSFGYLYSTKSLFLRWNFQWQPLALAVFLLLSTLIGLAAGPSSAIALIPRLDWWPDGDLFAFYTKPERYDANQPSPFTMYIPKLLFPSVVDESSLPGSYCLNADLDVNGSCPFAGFPDLSSSLNFTTLTDNVTLDTPLHRVMATWVIGPYSSALTWTTSHLLVNYMSLGSVQDTSIGSYNPSTIEAMTHLDSVMTPMVSVDCRQQPAAVYNRNLSTEFESLVGNFGLAAPSGVFDVRTAWNGTTLGASNKTMVMFDEDPPNATIPGILALVHTPPKDHHAANISICSVTAVWKPSKLWVLENGGGSAVSSDFTWTSYREHVQKASYDARANDSRDEKVNQIKFRKGWVDALNPVSNISATALLAQLLQDGADAAAEQGPTPLQFSDNYSNDASLAHSIILSKAIADGISRIGAEYRVSPLNPLQRNITVCRNKWCSSGPYFSTMDSLSMVFNGTQSGWDIHSPDLQYTDWQPNDQLMHSYPEPEDITSKWTRISFPKKRYGYAWSFGSVTIKVATAILMLHTLIIVVHCCYLLFTGRYYTFASSLGELVALALNSQPPAALSSTSVAIKKESSWTRSTAVRECQGHGKDAVDRLELVADDHAVQEVEDRSLHRRPVVGKRYH